jgi:hypothetical protein
MNTLTETQRERVVALLREGKTLRRIERETGHRRETIAAYGRRAGLIAGDVTLLDGVREPQSICEPHRELIAERLADGVPLRCVHEELVRRFDFAGSYSAVKRYVRTQVERGTLPVQMLAA